MNAASSNEQPCRPVVLHVRVVTGSGGGPDKTILRSTAHARSRGIDMSAAFIRPTDDRGFDRLVRQADELGCPLVSIAEAGPFDPRTLVKLARLCKAKCVDVWHGHDYKSNLLGLMIRRLTGVRLVTTVHGWTRHSRRTRLYYHVDNLCLRRFEQVMAVSQALFDHCLMKRVPHERLSFVPNGIDCLEFHRRQPMAAARAAMGVPADRFVIGVVGRLSTEKGADRAIEAAAALIGQYSHLQLHLVGDGPQRDALARLAQQRGIGQAVRFYGWQGDTRRFYEMMDMLLLPSHTEGLPNVVLEAMAMQVPVAATRVGGVHELLDAGRCGVILGRDESSWPANVAPLIVSPDRRAEFARRALARIEEHYSFDQRMAMVYGVYERMIGGRVGRREETVLRPAA